MPSGGDLYAKDLIKTLRKKHASGTYRSMVIYIEACEAGSIFQGLLPKDWNIYVTTASNPSESSWATYCPGSSQGPSPPSEYDTCLGDLYSVAWMEDSDVRDLQAETLEQQYRVVKSRTASGKDIGSHVMQYGDINLSRDPLSLYMGINPYYNPKNHSHHHHHHLSHPVHHAAFDQHEADIIYLKEKVRKAAEGSFQKAQAQKKLDEAIAHRKHVDSSIEAIGKALFGVDNASEVLKTVRSADQALVDDWDCLKMLVASYKTYCGPLLSYGMQYTRAFANMCNAGVQKEQVIKATSLVCKNRLNI